MYSKNIKEPIYALKMRIKALILLIFGRKAFYDFNKLGCFCVGIFRIIKSERNFISFGKWNTFAKRIDPLAVFSN